MPGLIPRILVRHSLSGSVSSGGRWEFECRKRTQSGRFYIRKPFTRCHAVTAMSRTSDLGHDNMRRLTLLGSRSLVAVGLHVLILAFAASSKRRATLMPSIVRTTNTFVTKARKDTAKQTKGQRSISHWVWWRETTLFLVPEISGEQITSVISLVDPVDCHTVVLKIKPRTLQCRSQPDVTKNA